MSVAEHDQFEELGAALLEQLLMDAAVRLRPKRVQVTSVTDALDQDAYRVVLVLPRPTAESWDEDEVFDARRAAVRQLDSMVDTPELRLPGQTVAFVSAEDDAQSRSEADVPQPGEDPVADRQTS